MIVEAVKPLPLFADEAPSVLSSRQTLIRRLKTTDILPYGGTGSRFWLQEPLYYNYKRGWLYMDGVQCAWFTQGTDELLPAELLPRVCSRGCIIIEGWWEESLSEALPEDIIKEDCPNRGAFVKTWKAHYPDVNITANPNTWVLHVSVIR